MKLFKLDGEDDAPIITEVVDQGRYRAYLNGQLGTNKVLTEPYVIDGSEFGFGVSFRRVISYCPTRIPKTMSTFLEHGASAEAQRTPIHSFDELIEIF